MLFTRMLEHTMVIRRLTATTGIKRTYSDLGPYPCMLQPLDDQKVALHGLAMGYAYTLYCNIDVPIKESDEVIANGISLKVAGIKTYNFGIHQHKEILVHTESNSV